MQKEIDQIRTLLERLSNQQSDQNAMKQTIGQISLYLERLQSRFRP